MTAITRNWIPCDECQGTGLLWFGEVADPCPDCDSTGFVTVTSELRDPRLIFAALAFVGVLLVLGAVWVSR